MDEQNNLGRVDNNYYKFAVVKGNGKLRNFKGKVKKWMPFYNGNLIAIEFEDGKSVLTNSSNVYLYNSENEVEEEA